MGRPKGSKSNPQLDPSNIIQSKNREDSQSASTSQPVKQKTSIGTRGAKKSKTSQVYNDLVGNPIEFLPKSKLPQNKVVLQRYISLREKFPKQNINMLVDILYSELVTGIWQPARIFTVTEKDCKKRIKAVIQKYNDFKNHPYKGSQDCPKNVSKFQDFLTQLCDLSPPNLKEMLQGTSRLNPMWEEDWQFYLNMCQTKQVGCVAGVDWKLSVKESNKVSRLCAEEARKNKEDQAKRKVVDIVSRGDQDDDSESEGDNRDDPDLIIKQKSKKPKLKLEIDPSKIVEQTSSTFDRLGLSSRQSVWFLQV